MRYSGVVVVESYIAEELTEKINEALKNRKLFQYCVEVDVQIARSGKYLATIKFEG